MKSVLGLFRKSSDADLKERFKDDAALKQAYRVEEETKALKQEILDQYQERAGDALPKKNLDFKPKDLGSNYQPDTQKLKTIAEESERYNESVKAVERMREDAFKQIEQGRGNTAVADLRTQFTNWQATYDRQQEAGRALPGSSTTAPAKDQDSGMTGAEDPLAADSAESVAAAVAAVEARDEVTRYMSPAELKSYESHKAAAEVAKGNEAGGPGSGSGTDDGHGL